MGIRMDQFMGFPPEAEAFMTENEQSLEICPTCKRSLPRDNKVIDSYTGIFDNEFSLYRRLLKDGRYADEFHQTAPWDCGPMHFLGLRVSSGEEFRWTEEQIAEAMGVPHCAEAAVDIDPEDIFESRGGY